MLTKDGGGEVLEKVFGCFLVCHGFQTGSSHYSLCVESAWK